MVSVDGSFTPEVEYSRKLGVCRAKLSFRWPANFHVFGKASTDSEALENAYQSACRAFMVRYFLPLIIATYKHAKYVLKVTYTVKAIVEYRNTDISRTTGQLE